MIDYPLRRRNENCESLVMYHLRRLESSRGMAKSDVAILAAEAASTVNQNEHTYFIPPK